MSVSVCVCVCVCVCVYVYNKYQFFIMILEHSFVSSRVGQTPNCHLEAPLKKHKSRTYATLTLSIRRANMLALSMSYISFLYSVLLRKTEYIAIGQDRGGGDKKGHVVVKVPLTFI